MASEIRLLTRADLDQAWELDSQSFNTPSQKRERWIGFQDPAAMHGVFVEDRLVALSQSLPFGQYFGERRVSMGGLSSVSVAPEHRGAGHAGRAVTASLRAMRERGEVISALFPGTTQLYRGLGWELAGAYVLWKIVPRSLLALARPQPGRVRRATPSDLPAIKQFYAQQARYVNGHLDRSAWGWWKLEHLWDEHYVYLAIDADQNLEGYLVYKHGEIPAAGGDFPIRVVEAVASNRCATEALWWLIASSGSQVDEVTYTGSPEDPLALLLPEQDARTFAAIRWMLRIVDAAAAIEQRGYSRSLELEVPLRLTDEQLPENQGDWTLVVSKGEGRLERRGSGGVELGIGAFSSLYSGWATTAKLEQAGLLHGGSDEARACLDSAFAGPTPWMLEEF